MYRSKVIDLLQLFNTKEINEIKVFINSPFFNKNKNIIKLYEELHRYHPAFDDNKFTKELLYKSIFNNRDYNDKILRNLMSELYKLLEVYIVHKGAMESQFKEMFILDKISGSDKLFLKKYNETMVNFNKSKIDSNYYYLKSLLLGSKIDYYLFINKQNKIVLDALKYSEYKILDMFMILPFSYSDLIANKTTFDIDFGNNIFEKFLEVFNFDEYINSIDVTHPEYLNLKFSYDLLMMHFRPSPDSEKHFSQVLDFLSQNHGNFNIFYLNIIVTSINNYYTANVTSMREVFADRMLKLYKFMLKINAGYSDFYPIEIINLKNILQTAMIAGEIEWAESFVNEYAQKVQPDIREDFMNLCLAIINFEKKKYDEALKHINAVRSYHFSFKFNIKQIQLMSYYELKNIESFYSVLETLRKYIEYSSEVSDSKRNIYKAYIRFMNHLMQVFLEKNANDSRIEKLKDDILKYSSDHFLSYKRWFIAKLDELI